MFKIKVDVLQGEGKWLRAETVPCVGRNPTALKAKMHLYKSFFAFMHVVGIFTERTAALAADFESATMKEKYNVICHLLL